MIQKVSESFVRTANIKYQFHIAKLLWKINFKKNDIRVLDMLNKNTAKSRMCSREKAFLGIAKITI